MRQDTVRALADAIAHTQHRSGKNGGLGQVVKYWPATYQGAESVDSNLSQLHIAGQTFRYVPRLASAWSSTPAVGTTLAVLQVGGSLLILGPMVGDTSLATH